MDRAMLAFVLLLGLVIGQRLLELKVSRRNTEALLDCGGLEFGRKHYPAVVLVHILFFAGLITEAAVRGVRLSGYSPYAFTVFLLAQVGRAWVVRTMNGRWTTRIIVVPGERLIRRGPFRYFPHPNYLVVAVEIASLPLVFSLQWSAVTFTALNAFLLLFVRIPEEKQALRWAQKEPAPKISA